MACPGGCIGGGGSPIPTNTEIRLKRIDATYVEDKGMALRKSHENPAVAELYADFLKDFGVFSHFYKGLAHCVLGEVDAATVEAFGLKSAAYAVLFFDKTRKLVGVQISKNASEDGALKLSRRRRSVSLKAPQFFEQYGLSFDEAQRFDVGQDPSNKMLTISLKHIKRRRGRRPKKS